jgi:hypothetical protein
VLTRLSPWVYVFGAVALLQMWAGWREWSGTFAAPQPGDIPLLLHAFIPSVVIPLFGVALFVRHPDARRTMPLLVFGVSLFTFGEILDVVDTQIRTALVGPDALPGTPADVAYGVFTSLVRLFAILYTGAGLAATRRAAPTRAERPLTIWLVALAVIGTVISVASVLQLNVQQATAADLLILAIQIVLSLLVTLAWAYLVSVTIGGALADEEPGSAWSVAALGASIVFGFRLLAGAVFGVGEPWFTIVTVGSYVGLVGWVLLLVAFGFGLPSPPDADADDLEPTADPRAATPPGSAAG